MVVKLQGCENTRDLHLNSVKILWVFLKKTIDIGGKLAGTKGEIVNRILNP